jgi:salicylate hydroxylase
MAPPEAIVVGAGIGGLACALGLQRAGWSVRVCEKSAVLGEVGAGLTLSPNAVRALQWLGCFERVQARLSLPPHQIMEDPLSGAEIGRLTRGPRAVEQYGAPYAFVHRADLHAALVEAVREYDAAALSPGAECIAVREQRRRAVLEFADGSDAEADLVVGCDGIRSRVRTALFGDEAPRYSGYVAWRAVVPYGSLPTAALPVGSAVVFGTGRCFVRYRLEPRRLLNFVAFAQRAQWVEESWTVPTAPTELRALFADWHAGVVETLAAVPDGALYCWGLFDREPLDTYARGTVALLGDAAHPMLPFLGQGAALALEDAVVLARLLTRPSDVPAALVRYDALRRPRGSAAVLESRAAGSRMHGDGGDPRTRNEETLDYFRYDAGAVDLDL